MLIDGVPRIPCIFFGDNQTARLDMLINGVPPNPCIVFGENRTEILSVSSIPARASFMRQEVAKHAFPVLAGRM